MVNIFCFVLFSSFFFRFPLPSSHRIITPQPQTEDKHNRLIRKGLKELEDVQNQAYMMDRIVAHKTNYPGRSTLLQYLNKYMEYTGETTDMICRKDLCDGVQKFGSEHDLVVPAVVCVGRHLCGAGVEIKRCGPRGDQLYCYVGFRWKRDAPYANAVPRKLTSERKRTEKNQKPEKVVIDLNVLEDLARKNLRVSVERLKQHELKGCWRDWDIHLEEKQRPAAEKISAAPSSQEKIEEGKATVDESKEVSDEPKEHEESEDVDDSDYDGNDEEPRPSKSSCDPHTRDEIKTSKTGYRGRSTLLEFLDHFVEYILDKTDVIFERDLYDRLRKVCAENNLVTPSAECVSQDLGGSFYGFKRRYHPCCGPYYVGFRWKSDAPYEKPVPGTTGRTRKYTEKNETGKHRRCI